MAAIAAMSAARSASSRLALDRSEDWIRYGITKRRLLCGLSAVGSRHVEFLVTEEAQRAVAYVVITVHEGQWFVEDAGDQDPDGARVGAMLEALLARTPHLDPPEIRAWLPHGLRPPQLDVIQSQQAAEVLMIRPLKDRTLPPIGVDDVVYSRLDYF
jgi:hypothetical protein